MVEGSERMYITKKELLEIVNTIDEQDLIEIDTISVDQTHNQRIRTTFKNLTIHHYCGFNKKIYDWVSNGCKDEFRSD